MPTTTWESYSPPTDPSKAANPLPAAMQQTNSSRCHPSHHRKDCSNACILPLCLPPVAVTSQQVLIMHETQRDSTDSNAEETIHLMMADEIKTRLRTEAPATFARPEIRKKIFLMMEAQYRHEAEKALIRESRLYRIQRLRQRFSVILFVLFALLMAFVMVLAYQSGDMQAVSYISSAVGLLTSLVGVFITRWSAKRTENEAPAGLNARFKGKDQLQ